MKQKIFFLGLVILGIILISGCTQKQPTNDISRNEAEFTETPKEYIIYQEYLQAIGEGLSATPRFFDNGVIEATVLSITKSNLCPSATGETCNIEPYPNDYAVVRIDKIVSYSPYSEKTAIQPVEQTSGAQSEDGSSTPGYTGTEYPKQKIPEIKRLQEGQKVSTHFLITTRPVKIRYVSVKPRNDGLESQQSGNVNSKELTQTITHSATRGKKTFEPIPKENEYFVFTTKIIPYPEVSQKTLPGLNVGDKFRANIKYDGTTLVVEEYEIIS